MVFPEVDFDVTEEWFKADFKKLDRQDQEEIINNLQRIMNRNPENAKTFKCRKCRCKRFYIDIIHLCTVAEGKFTIVYSNKKLNFVCVQCGQRYLMEEILK